MWIGCFCNCTEGNIRTHKLTKLVSEWVALRNRAHFVIKTHNPRITFDTLDQMRRATHLLRRSWRRRWFRGRHPRGWRRATTPSIGCTCSSRWACTPVKRRRIMTSDDSSNTGLNIQSLTVTDNFRSFVVRQCTCWPCTNYCTSWSHCNRSFSSKSSKPWPAVTTCDQLPCWLRE